MDDKLSFAKQIGKLTMESDIWVESLPENFPGCRYSRHTTPSILFATDAGRKRKEPKAFANKDIDSRNEDVIHGERGSAVPFFGQLIPEYMKMHKKQIVDSKLDP